MTRLSLPCGANLAATASQLEDRPASEVIAWAIDRFADRFAVVTAFQAEGMVVLDLARRLAPDVRAITIDSGRLPQESHDFIDAVRARFDLNLDVVVPEAAPVEAMVRRHGQNLFRRDVALRQLCCQVRKVEPLRRVLATVDAWASGLRRDMGPTRAGIAKVELDPGHGPVKVHPLADWSREQVWAYIRAHSLPVHPLYDQGYASIGCAPCTRALRAGEDERAGRWWWEAGSDRECGLHHASRSERFAALLADLADKDVMS